MFILGVFRQMLELGDLFIDFAGPGDDDVLQRGHEPVVLGADGEAGNRRRTNNVRK